MKIFRQRIEASNTLLLVAEPRPHWLRNVQHVRDIVPAVWVVCCGEIFIKHTRTVFLEESNERIAARPAIQPQCKWVLGRIVA